MSDGEHQSRRFFYGLEPRWLSCDRLYRIYVSDRAVAGAYVAGQIYDERSAAVQLRLARLLRSQLIRRLVARRQEREACYDSLDPFGRAFLDHDPRNFQIPRSDVARARFWRNRSLWTPFNDGTIEFVHLDGGRRRFVLVGDQEPDAVLRLMQRLGSTVEVTGEPSAPRRSRTISPAGRRGRLLVMAAMLLGMGALFGHAAWAGVARNPILMPLALVNVLASGWCLVSAWRVTGREPNADDAERTGRGT